MDPAASMRLGHSDVTVTRLGLGTAPLGNLYDEVTDEVARATVHSAYEHGLRLIDTAPLYGHGLAEQRLGATLAELPDDVVLATKVGRLLREAPAGRAAEPSMFVQVPSVSLVRDYSRDGVLRSVEESLQRLGVARVDILHIHDPDDHEDQALREAFPALAELRSQGVARAIGAGMNQAAMLARFAAEADFDCFLIAGRYTLLDQSALVELLPACAERGIGVLVGGAYNSGILANPEPGARYDYEPAGQDLLARAHRLAAVCARYEVPLKAAAIQFPFGHPAVTSVVVGARSPAEIAQNVEMAAWPVPGDLWAELRAESLLPADIPVPT
jgi:D-threo-aldose 1-dehydrogenase